MIDDKNQCSNFNKLEYRAIKITKIEFKKDKTQILLNLMDLNIDMRKVKEMLDIGEYQY